MLWIFIYYLLKDNYHCDVWKGQICDLKYININDRNSHLYFAYYFMPIAARRADLWYFEEYIPDVMHFAI